MISSDGVAEVEGDAHAIFRLARFDPDDGATPQQLCVRLLGSPPEMAPLLGHEATLARVTGQWRIFVRAGTAAPRARWLVCHELAEWWYQRIGYCERDIEARCDVLGAALVAPRRVFLRLRRRHGDDVRPLARALRTTESLALLRCGECTGEPTAVVRSAGAIVRGDAVVWPAPLTLARAHRLRRGGLRKVRIADEPSRLGLRLA